MNLSPRWPDWLADALVDALRRLRDALERGALLTLDAKRARLRILPLRPLD